ncbi:SDR family oxidoreductase [Subtercola boreus]|uniref:NAD(P)-dependent oxidoreductase n=1 Tax=Subtercola boreus TaxID=120213 RepID=A0A3E0WGJ8_9MICO|nr:SDR family oxidoreductase [Subtercola boreus]RFA23372.1 NAD(P)-dependent oxidoreductase [Subtercola boreus]RFA23765.1 NAD(P)-dependent oxidoreductase [Subtercola boreus]RFA29466.1 NAD(P)-dependent oxidoreductase [Subtercola boreus]
MSLVVTGATGQLGRLVITNLLARGVDPAEIVAAGRNTEKVAALEGLGVRTAVIDFADPSTLASVFGRGDTVLLVSGSDLGGRVEQHQNVIDAAKAAGVSRIVYTSAPRADSTDLILAPEHKATEEYLRASGAPFTILRNNWYTENYAQTLTQAEATGVYAASTGEGRVASASRHDYAEAAAVSLITDGLEGRTFELSGDTAWNGTEFAATLAEVLGRDVRFESLSTEAHTAALLAAGLDEGTAGFVAGLDANIAAGALDKSSDDLSTLIGRPTTPAVDTLRELARS